MKNQYKSAMLIAALALSSCVDNSGLEDYQGLDDNLVEQGPMKGMNVPDDFNYSTTKKVDLHLKVPKFLKNSVVEIFGKTGAADSILIGRGTFDDNGQFSRPLTLGATVDSLLVYSDYAGLTREVRLPVENEMISFDYTPLYSERNTKGDTYSSPYEDQTKGKLKFNYLDRYNDAGLPENLETPDVLDQTLLADINNSLPEGTTLMDSHPEYLSGKATEIVLTEESDVWLTFVSEGAGYRNSLGFYTYELGNPPATVDDIEDLTIVLPNASMMYSGGMLIPGDRIHLGKFTKNTVISWFLVSSGWAGGGKVKDYALTLFADPRFNPEPEESLRQHMVLLYDQARDISFLGFEDMNRTWYSCDHDFNDAVFYVKTSVDGAVDTDNVATIDPAKDTDNDGVSDSLDEYPEDPDKSFNNYYPSKENPGTLMYEDLWPSLGDYDFNDVALDYGFNLVTNSANMVTQINATYTINNIGGSFKNGLAFVLPISQDAVTATTGQLLNGGYEEVGANGTELGSAANEAIFIVAGNTHNQLGNTFNITIDLNTPQSLEDLGEAPFNTFLIVNGDRSREVHLPDLDPTSKADHLGTQHDYSDPSLKRFYKTNKNLPWAINIFEPIAIPQEQVSIISAYPKFKTWANSGGAQDEDWYKK